MPFNVSSIGLLKYEHIGLIRHGRFGFRKANNAKRAQYRAGNSDRASRHMYPVIGGDTSAAQRVLGNFRETLKHCGNLLNDQRHFQKCDGFVSTINQYCQIDPEVQTLKERIFIHNIKGLKLVGFHSLLVQTHYILQDTNKCRSEILEDRSIQMIDSTTAIFSAIEQLGSRFRGEEGSEYHLNNLPGSVAIPQELQDCFMAVTQNMYPDFANFTLCQGIDAAFLYLNKVTKATGQLAEREITYLTAIIDIMNAAWILRTANASQEFQIAARYCPVSAFEQQMDKWGMTVERFFEKCEEVIYFINVLEKLLLGRHLLLPPTPKLLEIFEKERQIWPEDLGGTLKKETKPMELGVKIKSTHLRASDPSYTQTISVYRQTEKRFNLQLLSTSTSERREKETIDGYDIEHVQIIPHYAKRTWTSPSSEPQTILFRVDSISPVYRVLAFHQNKDLFEFQQAITGYKVVHDDIRVLVTSQESKLLRGTRRQDLCRLQLWSAPSPRADVSTTAQMPYLEPTAPEVFTISKPPRRKYSASNMFLFSSKLRSSSSSKRSVITDPLSPSNFDVPAGPKNTKDTIYQAPAMPCIVLFAHKVQNMSRVSEERQTLRSFLIIEISAEVTVQDELAEDEHNYGPVYKCVIEKIGSYLPARRSPETSDPGLWDLAVAGIHKRQAGTEEVKRLKHVIIQFDTQHSLLQFTTKFNQVKDLANLRLSQFVSLTRAGPKAGSVELP
ncbi:hypothetical protein BGZ60DRAFT_520732 [Tricladium varicosporioides]|nr:hypothetical protein BGZ60DRAFT_520732 [Hymenoscyphus varicosporioides]